MAYGAIYNSYFDSFQPLLSYYLFIYKKDYTGSNTSILLSGNPVIHEWQDDDPKAPIKGSTLKVSILTDANGIQLSDFYSEDDYGYYCELSRVETDEILFKGYLLQDDSQELQVDFTHEIQLTFTDGLGLLKDITLDQAAIISGVDTPHTSITVESYIPSFFNTIMSSDAIMGDLQPGDVFTITSGGLAGTYTVISVNFNAGVYYIVTDSTNMVITAAYTTTINWIEPYPLTGYIPLIDIYKLCLKSTYINSGLNCYSRLFPVGGTNERLLDDTFIQAETFLKSNEWMNCYDILEQINSRFNLSLFQSSGIWNLMRWDELYRYTTNTGATLQYHTYSTDFVYSATSTSNEVWTFKKGNDMEVGVLKSINRANQFVKETFNYVQPESLLCNYNLQDLGALVNQYDSGLTTIKEYDFLYWTNYNVYPTPPNPTRLIRIIYDNDPISDRYGQEIDRYAVITGPSATFLGYSAESCPIMMNAGDRISFSFDLRSEDAYTAQTIVQWNINLQTGSYLYGVNDNGQWGASGFFHLNYYFLGNTSQEWMTINITTDPLPESGLVYVYLPQFPRFAPDYTTYIKNMNFRVIYSINSTTRYIGHTHKDSQTEQIKNNIDKEIFIDDSPKVSINGSLFLDSYTNLVRNLTVRWQYPGASYNYPRLGQGTTQESLFTSYKMRSKYEGKYLFINQEDVMLNNLALFVDNQNYNFFRYAPGRMAIDYKNGHADLSLWEIIDSPGGNFQPGGAGITFDYLAWAATKLYEFNYLYEKS